MHSTVLRSIRVLTIIESLSLSPLITIISIHERRHRSHTHTHTQHHTPQMAMSNFLYITKNLSKTQSISVPQLPLIILFVHFVHSHSFRLCRFHLPPRDILTNVLSTSVRSPISSRTTAQYWQSERYCDIIILIHVYINKMVCYFYLASRNLYTDMYNISIKNSIYK